MAKPRSQRKLIEAATQKAILKRDKYTDKRIVELTNALDNFEDKVKSNILRYEKVGLGDLTKGQSVHLKALQSLETDIGKLGTGLANDQRLIMQKAVKWGYKEATVDGIEALVKAQIPAYAGLSKEAIAATSRNLFQLVDKNAMDFLANFQTSLAGEVSKGLTGDIMQQIQIGIASGKDVNSIVRDLGSVIKDQDAFKRAGATTFKKAQTRMRMIARTEIIRAHNQGQQKFYSKIGIEKFIWNAVGDERTDPVVCAVNDGKTFVVHEDEAPPAHPNCRCWTEPVIDDDTKLKTPKEIQSAAEAKKPVTEPTALSPVQEHEANIAKYENSFSGKTDLLKQSEQMDPDLLRGRFFRDNFLDPDEREIYNIFIDDQKRVGGWIASSTSDGANAWKATQNQLHGGRLIYDGKYMDTDNKLLSNFASKNKKFLKSLKVSEAKAQTVAEKIEAYNRVMFERTFKGKKDITVFRGVKKDFFTGQNITMPSKGNKVNIMNDMSSWTDNEKAARHFAGKDGTIMATKISKDDIAGSYLGGNGFPWEKEYIVKFGERIAEIQ